jgi:hypothetical protein
MVNSETDEFPETTPAAVPPEIQWEPFRVVSALHLPGGTVPMPAERRPPSRAANAPAFDEIVMLGDREHSMANDSARENGFLKCERN